MGTQGGMTMAAGYISLHVMVLYKWSFTELKHTKETDQTHNYSTLG